MGPVPATSNRPPRGLLLAASALVLAFGLPLFRLAQLALHSELYSYLLVVPLISLGLIWLNRAELPAPSRPNRPLAAGFLAAGAVAGVGAVVSRGDRLRQEALSLAILSFLLLLVGACAWFLGRRTLRAIAFPLGFLAWLVPIPPFLADWLTDCSQRASAAISTVFLEIAGVPVFRRDPLTLQLPGISLQVAPQCAGLHSSLALLIISLPAGYLMLRSPWRRALLTLAVIPIALLRNGFRIFTIGTLCVRVGPQEIDSYLHRSGGWVFFLLSFGILLFLLLWLAQSERLLRKAASAAPAASAAEIRPPASNTM